MDWMNVGNHNLPGGPAIMIFGAFPSFANTASLETVSENLKEIFYKI